MTHHVKTGILLINLGTPRSPTAADVKSYLTEFLTDPEVITAPGWVRSLLFRRWIVPRRAPRSAEAYQKIWTREGSPLLVHTEALGRGVAARVGGESRSVEIAMRYGSPSIASALAKLRATGVDQLLVLPLYPQYSGAATLSSLHEVSRQLAGMDWHPRRCDLRDFFAEPFFVDPIARQIEEARAQETFDHVLLTFHGLPERHIRRADPSKNHCLVSSDCCDRIDVRNRACYRAQCYGTARAIADRAGLSPNQYSVAFQSRLGPTRWMPPFANHLLSTLPANGVKNLLVACPSFTADCLETLEEIGIRGRELFLSSGGHRWTLLPCLNAREDWVEGLSHWLLKQEEKWSSALTFPAQAPQFESQSPFASSS